MPNIIGCLLNLDKMSLFFKEEEDFHSQYDDSVDVYAFLSKLNRHNIVHTEDNSITEETREY